uniref:Tetraspanin n=1 Tax=Trichobilharzia regenti TaxID=157069 RepID=A0AA85K885_TRIRE|nr:unnamed protein product [Trichobilharzia regenti]
MFLCQKWILHCLTVFNIFHLITGCIALSSGIYEFTYSEYHFLRGKYELSLFTGSYITCTCGVFILITSPLGWVGILSQSKSLLTMFCILLVLSGICLLGCGIWATKYSENIHYELEQMFNRLLDNYDEKRLMVNEDTKFFNYLQYKLDCCGKLSVEDLSDRKPILACGLKAGEKKGCLSKLTGLTKSGQFRIALVNYCIAVCQKIKGNNICLPKSFDHMYWAIVRNI